MADKKNKTKLKKFFDENRTLVFTIPVFLILVIVVIVVYVSGGSRNNSAEVTPIPTNNTQPTAQPQNPAPTGTSGTTLPQNERDKDSDEISRNPFADPYKVSGIIYDKSGASVAIIEAENKSFIVKAGDEAGDYFKVLNIEENRVVLEVDGQELVLTLAAD